MPVRCCAGSITRAKSALEEAARTGGRRVPYLLATPPEERNLILEVVGYLDGAVHGPPRPVRDSGVAFLVSTNRKAIQPRVLLWGLALQFGFAFLVLKTDFGKLFQIASHRGERPARLCRKRAASSCSDRWARRPARSA